MRHEYRHSTAFYGCPRRRRIGWLWPLAALLLVWSGAATGVELDPAKQIIFSLQEETGSFYTRGVVEFCYEGECIFADIDLGYPGHFTFRVGQLQPDVPYTVMIYDTKMNVLYEMREWVFEPELYDGKWSSLYEVDKILVFPQFHAQDERRLTFQIATTLNPKWQELSGQWALTDVDDLPDYPTFWAGVRATMMVGGKFTSDSEAAGGVIEVKPGFGLAAAWRSGYPDEPPTGEHWLSFRELNVTYSQNRYETDEVMTPGRTSDVTFHRVNVSYGFGQQSPFAGSHWSLAAAVSFGGIFDGSEKLQYLDRKYSLFGAGMQANYIQRLYHGRRVDLGLWLQGEAIYYPADNLENDFWYGLAPAVSLGLLIY